MENQKKSEITLLKPLEGAQREMWLAQKLATMQSAFPGKPLTPEAGDLYMTAMENLYQDVGQAKLQQACEDCINELKFMPTIAELRERCGRHAAMLLAVEQDKAWEFVRQYARCWSGSLSQFAGRDPETKQLIEYRSPGLPPRIKYAVRQCGGIRLISESTTESLVFIRRDFNAAFERYAFTDEAQENPKLLNPLPRGADHEALLAGVKLIGGKTEEERKQLPAADDGGEVADFRFGDLLKDALAANRHKGAVLNAQPLTDEQLAQKAQQARELCAKFQQEASA